MKVLADIHPSGKLFISGLFFAALTSGGCLFDTDCPRAKGEFVAEHEYIGGTCSRLQSIRYDFENTNTKATLVQTDLGGAVTTEVNRMGCAIYVSKIRSDSNGQNQWQMVGELDIEDEKTISGQMERYEWSEGGQISCRGIYYTKMKKVEAPKPAPPGI